jgi:hypothetical protein
MKPYLSNQIQQKIVRTFKFMQKSTIVLRAIRQLGKSTHAKSSRNSLIIKILLVLKSFMKKRLMTKAKKCKSDLNNGQASVLYNRIDKHLLQTNLMTTCSDANLPARP